jgi:hypothetical protein
MGLRTAFPPARRLPKTNLGYRKSCRRKPARDDARYPNARTYRSREPLYGGSP